jgi:DNA polymerase III alpha subunit
MSENIENNISNNQPKFAIRFGLGAIKAVGLKMMENAVEERKRNGKFTDIYDFCSRLDPKSINKKSIEALAKSGSFDNLGANRNQIADSFDILSAYAQQLHEAKNSNQMSLFGNAQESVPKPPLKSSTQWLKVEKLQKEFESFGFFLNEHPLDDHLSDLKKRGTIFFNHIAQDDLEDNSLVKMACVVLSSKHRSSARGRFAYLTVSDPYGIYEATIFDEALITSSRDLLEDGSMIAVECLIRKDVGGARILIKSVSRLDDFIKNVKPSDKDFVDIKKIKVKKNNFEKIEKNNNYNSNKSPISSPSRDKSKFNHSSQDKNQNITYSNDKLTEKSERQIKILKLIITDKSVISPLKIILQQKIDSNQQEQITQIFLVAKDSEKTTLFSLPKIYNIKEIDIIRFKNFNKNLQVEFEFI